MSRDTEAGSTGAHPTTAEFAEQLLAWGFTQRRTEAVHTVFRGPHGGTVRILRSLLGRADHDLVAKAARLAGVSIEDFWAAPGSPPNSQPSSQLSSQSGTSLSPEPATVAPSPDPARTGRRRQLPARDSIVSLVLAAHTLADRPLGFDQVVDICHGRITRQQASAASAQLCRDGDLDRIRAGVYQWSAGARAIPAISTATTVLHAVRHDYPAPPPPSAVPELPRAAQPGTTVELFDRLFPTGVHMTAELLADFERWAQLTTKIAGTAHAS